MILGARVKSFHHLKVPMERQSPRNRAYRWTNRREPLKYLLGKCLMKSGNTIPGDVGTVFKGNARGTGGEKTARNDVGLSALTFTQLNCSLLSL